MQSLLANNIMYNGNLNCSGTKAKVFSAFFARRSGTVATVGPVCRVVHSRQCAVRRESPRSAPTVAAQALLQLRCGGAAAPCSMQLCLHIGLRSGVVPQYPRRAASDDQLQRRLRRRLGDRQQSRAQLVPRELRCTFRPVPVLGYTVTTPGAFVTPHAVRPQRCCPSKAICSSLGTHGRATGLSLPLSCGSGSAFRASRSGALRCRTHQRWLSVGSALAQRWLHSTVSCVRVCACRPW